MRKEQNLVEGNRLGWKLAWQGKNGVRLQASRRVNRFSHLMIGNNRRRLLDGRNGMQRPGMIENVKWKIHVKAREVL